MSRIGIRSGTGGRTRHGALTGATRVTVFPGPERSGLDKGQQGSASHDQRAVLDRRRGRGRIGGGRQEGRGGRGRGGGGGWGGGRGRGGEGGGEEGRGGEGGGGGGGEEGGGGGIWFLIGLFFLASCFGDFRNGCPTWQGLRLTGWGGAGGDCRPHLSGTAGSPPAGSATLTQMPPSLRTGPAAGIPVAVNARRQRPRRRPRPGRHLALDHRRPAASRRPGPGPDRPVRVR